MAAGRLAAEVVIEGDDAVHLGAGQIERLGDHRLGRLGDIAKSVLEAMENREQRPLGVPVTTDDLGRQICVPP